MTNNRTNILSSQYEKLTVKQVINGKEMVLLEINDASETPITSSEDILVILKPKQN